MECGHKVNYGDLIATAKETHEGLVAEVMQYIETSALPDRQCEALKTVVKRAIWLRHRELLGKLGQLLQLTDGSVT